MKKTKQPGDNISLKTKKSEDPAVMNWINAQTNLMDSLRYLIENEIVHNGIRNLQAYIPMERNVFAPGFPSQEASVNASYPQSDRETAAAADGIMERGGAPQQAVPAIPVGSTSPEPKASSVQEGALSARPVQEVEPTPPVSAGPSVQQPRTEPPDPQGKHSRPEPPVEDEIDDEDIEAWI